MANTYLKNRTTDLEIFIVYASLIIYFGLNPIVKLLNYLGVAISIKSEVCLSILIAMYFIVNIVKNI